MYTAKQRKVLKMGRDEKTIVVSQISKVSIGMNENGLPQVTIESAAPYKELLKDAMETYVSLVALAEVDDEEEYEEPEENSDEDE